MRLLRNLFGSVNKNGNNTIESRNRRSLGAARGIASGKPSTLLARSFATPALRVQEDGANVLDEIVTASGRAVIITHDDAASCALFALHSHCLDAAQVSPLLAITAPAHGCGKTTLLRVMAGLVPSPLVVSDISAAALYRSVNVELRRTLLIDEGHSLISGGAQLQRILNAGHCRDGAAVARADGIFDLWCAKIIALIGELPPSLADRAVRIDLKRKRVGETVMQLDAVVPALRELAQRAARWSAQHFDQIAAADPVMPEPVINRAADNWRALLAIADAAGGRWPELARTLATKAAADTAIEDASALALLRDLASYFRHVEANGLGDRISSEDLCFYLATLQDRPWLRLNRGGPITSYQVARLLRPFGIRSQTIRFDDGVAKGYYIRDFHDAFERYVR